MNPAGPVPSHNLSGAGRFNAGTPLVTGPAHDPLWASEVANPARVVAFWFGLGVVFVRFSMIHEALAFSLQRDLYLLYIFTIPAAVGVLVTGGLQRMIRTPAVRLWLGFALWMAMAVPFSSWRGGSFDAVTGYLKTELPIMVIITGLTMTWRECKLLIGALAMAALVDLAISDMFQGESAGRVALQMTGGSIANPNDLAGHLILLLPFMFGFAFLPKRHTVVRLLALAAAGYGYMIILGTASRGAMLAMLCSAVFILWRATPSQRVGAMVLIPAFAVFAILMLPAETRSRLTSFSTKQQSYNDEAGGSAESRMYLLKQSIRFSFERPIFGVGPGNFASFEGGRSQEEGRHGSWHNAHNSYTQVSAENGIPALMLYLFAIISASRLLASTDRQARQAGPAGAEISVITFWTLVSFIGFFTAITFLNFYQKFYIPALIGMAAVMAQAAARELMVRTPVVSPIAPPPGGPQRVPLAHPVR